MHQIHHLRRLILLLFLTPLAASAHVGSRDIYLQGNAGPYPVYISVQPPVVIPGLATVSVFLSTKDDATLQSISVQPNVLSSDPAQRMPAPEVLAHNALTHVWQGSVWLMTPGSWQLRFQVLGNKGDGVLAVPVPATSTQLKRMSKTIGTVLAICCILLILGLAGMAAAAVRESTLEPGLTPDKARRMHGKVAVCVALLVCFGLLLLGNHWWRVEIARYGGTIYKPLNLQPSLSPDGSVLHLALTDPGWISQRRLDDLVPDHNHLMHLYMVREPAMDFVLHLHPQQIAPGSFDLQLPAMPAGKYALFADIVHADGFPDTTVATMDLPAKSTPAASADADDSEGVVTSLNDASIAASSYTLPDGYHIQFQMGSPGQPLHAASNVNVTQPVILQFTLLDAHGQAPADMQNYMGMLGHAAILKTDGTVFAHIHPEGSMAMAAYMMVNHSADAMAGMDMSGMAMPAEKLPNVVAFPYGFPSAGRYRILIQMKHDGKVETGAFDLFVQ
jgi:hypothetical protein